ncbi:hypothetical protein JCM11251_001223 [Rhodosporidiobolus azoricus]
MLPFRDPKGLFYDPANPVMLPEDEIMQLSPQELQAASDQLDQNLVLVLQQIEENFARCNQVVTERILPAVEQHGENSARIYESIRFWRPFFEAAASTRLNQPYGEEEASTVVSEEPSHATASPDQTISDEGDVTYGAPSVGGTPRPLPPSNGDASTSGLPSEPQWSNDMSPFQALQADMHEPAGHAGETSKKEEALPDVQRLRLRDLPPDSPDVPEPQFETVNLKNALGSSASPYGAPSPSAGKGKEKDEGRSFDLSSAVPSEPSYTTAFHQQPPPSPARNARAGGDKAHSALLEKILRKNLASPARPPTLGPGSSTPGPGTARKLKFPSDVPRDWNGIANLSQTSLDAFPSPIKRRASAASSMADASFAHVPSSARSNATYGAASPAPPPRTSALNASTSTLRRYPGSSSSSAVPPSPAFTRTPAKEAARRTAQNVYNALDPFDLLDSPMLEPPSALKNPATMAYRFDSTTHHGQAPEPDSPSERGTIKRGDASFSARADVGAERSIASAAGRGGYAHDESYNSLPAQPSFANASQTQALDLDAMGVGYGLNEPSRTAGGGGGGLADFGGGTTANIDDLLAGHTMTFKPDYAGIVDDDGGLGGHGEASFTDTGEAVSSGHSGEGRRPMDSTFTATQQQGYDHFEPLRGEEEYDEEEEDEFRRRGVRLPGQDGPEDTLFGMPARGGGGGAGGPAAPAKRGVSFGDSKAYEPEHGQQSYDEDGEDSFAIEARQSGFRLHGMDEMETLHGGELLASEPFQASPLAGRSHQ